MQYKLIFVLLLPIILTGHLSYSKNILYYMVIGSYSHRLSIWPLIEELASAGHNITVISPFENKHPDARIHEYIPKKWAQVLGAWGDYTDFYGERKNYGVKLIWHSLITYWSPVACESLYDDDEFIQWLRDSPKFDLVISDWDFNECIYGMAHHLWDSKVILYFTSNTMGWFQDQFGLPDETSSISDTILDYPPGKDMSFSQRFVNAFLPLLWTFIREYYYFPKLEEISRKGLEKVTGKQINKLASFSELERNVSLVFVTSHYSMSFQRSFPPNIVEVGGVAVPNDIKPLPKDIKEFIGDNEFVYVSLGSITEFTNFPEHTQAQFISAINSFPKLKIIWKLSKPLEVTLPENIKILSWAPQVSILAHPKLKGFISHAGLGAVTEAITFGVPMLMFPIFAEQDYNAQMLSSRSAGIRLEITDFTSEEMVGAMQEIFENAKYRKAMQTLSVFFKDRQISAKEKAVWWTEFVLRHDNLQQILRPPSVQQTWWVKRQIDVWLVATLLFIFISILTCYILIKCCKFIMGRVFIRKVKAE